MSLLKWLKKDGRKGMDSKHPIEDVQDDEEQRRREEEEGRDTGRRTNEEEARSADGAKFVYFACETPREDVITLLQGVNKDTQVC